MLTLHTYCDYQPANDYPLSKDCGSLECEANEAVARAANGEQLHYTLTDLHEVFLFAVLYAVRTEKLLPEQVTLYHEGVKIRVTPDGAVAGYTAEIFFNKMHLLF